MKSLHGPVITSKLSDEELAKYRAIEKPRLHRQSAATRHVDWEWPLHKKKKGANRNVYIVFQLQRGCR